MGRVIQVSKSFLVALSSVTFLAFGMGLVEAEAAKPKNHRLGISAKKSPKKRIVAKRNSGKLKGKISAKKIAKINHVKSKNKFAKKSTSKKSIRNHDMNEVRRRAIARRQVEQARKIAKARKAQESKKSTFAKLRPDAVSRSNGNGHLSYANRGEIEKIGLSGKSRNVASTRSTLKLDNASNFSEIDLNSRRKKHATYKAKSNGNDYIGLEDRLSGSPVEDSSDEFGGSSGSQLIASRPERNTYDFEEIMKTNADEYKALSGDENVSEVASTKADEEKSFLDNDKEDLEKKNESKTVSREVALVKKSDAYSGVQDDKMDDSNGFGDDNAEDISLEESNTDKENLADSSSDKESFLKEEVAKDSDSVEKPSRQISSAPKASIDNASWINEDGTEQSSGSVDFEM